MVRKMPAHPLKSLPTTPLRPSTKHALVQHTRALLPCSASRVGSFFIRRKFDLTCAFAPAAQQVSLLAARPEAQKRWVVLNNIFSTVPT